MKKRIIVVLCIALFLALILWGMLHFTPDLPQSDASPSQDHTTAARPTGSSDHNESSQTFLSDFLAAHNAGQKYTTAFEGNFYEISIHQSSRTCTIIHQQTYRTAELEVNDRFSYELDQMTTVGYTFYYQSTYRISDNSVFQCDFSRRHSQLSLPDISDATLKTIRAHLCQSMALSAAERQFWDVLLHGYVTEDTQSWGTLTLTSMHIDENTPVTSLNYYQPDNHRYRIVEVTDFAIGDYYYDRDGSRNYREYDPIGVLTAIGQHNADGSHTRQQYNNQGQLSSTLQRNADGSGQDTHFVWDNGTLTKSCYFYSFSSVEGLVRTGRAIEVSRYDLSDPTLEICISLHIYNENDVLTGYYLYDDTGKPTEDFSLDASGAATYRHYIYEDDTLVKIITTISTDGETVRREEIVVPDHSTSQP